MMNSSSGKRQIVAYYVYFIPLSIIIFKALDALIAELKKSAFLNDVDFVIVSTPNFLTSFFEGFSIIYAFSLPIIITRVWDKFDSIVREFDSEAERVKILYGEIKLIRWQNTISRDDIADLLYEYVQHVSNNYKQEGGSTDIEKNKGDKILMTIKQEISLLNRSSDKTNTTSDSFVSELLRQLNDVIRIRGNRIMLSQQSGVNNLRIVGLITSVLFVVPLYFVRFGLEFGLLDNIIVTGVTILVIYIYALIEDLDAPFEGIRKVGNKSWQLLVEEMSRDQKERKQKIGKRDVVRPKTNKNAKRTK